MSESDLTEREKEILAKGSKIDHPFVWSEIPASPMELSKLVVKGYLKVHGKVGSRNEYVVTKTQ